MPRYIDADALYDNFKNGISDTEQEKEFNRVGRYLVRHAPTADVVPVVRCKDCAKRRTEECALYCGTEHFRGGREVMTWCGAMYNDEFGCVRGADMRRESEVKE